MDEKQISIILSLLKQSVDLLYENDNYLIKNSVHEQDISHRIAHYLENLLKNHDWFVKNGYSIDVEYNRNFDDSKRVYRNCKTCSNGNECYIKNSHYAIDDYESICRPDIIIHKRGGNEQNIIAIEIKTNLKKSPKDYAKLAVFSCRNSEYKYELGIFINITEAKYKYFKNGQKITEDELIEKKCILKDLA